MTIDEIFPNPTVKKVIFQIKYPSLFYLENRIGDFQLSIMREFPQSNILFRRQVVFANVGPEARLEEVSDDLDSQTGAKIWQFKSDRGFTLNVLNSSLDITSDNHQTYNLEGGEKFRDVLVHVLECFFQVVSLPTIKRIGLRYINECPVPSRRRDEFESHYNTVFPLDRFNLADADEMLVRASTRRGTYNMRYIEVLRQVEGDYQLILDLDAFATDIDSSECLATTDELHALVVEEYERTVREAVFDYMRLEQEG